MAEGILYQINSATGTRELRIPGGTIVLTARDRRRLITLLAVSDEIVIPEAVDPGANPDRFVNEDGTTFTNEDGTQFQNETP